MRLRVKGQEQDFIPIKIFRETHTLPDSFSIAYFEPKDFTGLAAIDKAGSEMNDLRQGLLDSVPQSVARADLLEFYDGLQAMFRAGMYAINDAIGLKPEEIDFAVAGFGDVNQSLMYGIIRTSASDAASPDFDTIYREWLYDSVRLSTQEHQYTHDKAVWRVHIINHAYGRVGLQVDTGDALLYVVDKGLTCPAEGYMLSLLADLAALVMERLR